MKIARHFSAGNSVDDDDSPGRTTETLDFSRPSRTKQKHTVVPCPLSLVPALKCRAIIGLPLPGRGQLASDAGEIEPIAFTSDD